MRIWLRFHQRIYWSIGAAIIILMTYYYFQRKTPNDVDIPVLKKSFKRKSNAILVGPFNTKKHYEISEHSVTFATHTSLRNLYKLQVIDLVWRSPISVAVWAQGDITRLVELAYILTLACFQDRYLSITIAIPASESYNIDLDFINWNSILNPNPQLCTQRNLHNRFYELRALDKGENYNNNRIPYPNNGLRNFALANVPTPYVLVADIDLLPSVSMDKFITKYVHIKPLSKDTAVVIPVFECDKCQSNQWSAEKLVQGWQSGEVRQFYQETCPQCQGPTQYNNWLDRQSNKNTDLYKPSLVGYKPGWEPFIFMKTSAHPKYDERFKQFGYNRMSLICELHMSSVKFYVLDFVFLMHNGFKTEEGFHAEKDRELKANEQLYLNFRSELTRKLGSRRTC